MSDFTVAIRRIDTPVIHHPNADTLSIVKIDEYEAIYKKLPDNTHAFKQGDLLVYIPEGAAVPEWLLRKLSMWKEDETGPRKGMLSGRLGNVVKARSLRKIYSQGLLYAIRVVDGTYFLDTETGEVNLGNNSADIIGMDVATLLGIVKYEEPIPEHMAGNCVSVYGHTVKYDFNNWQSIPHIFAEGEEVIATEKLHGTNFCMGYIPNLAHPELFCNGDVFVASKGLGAKGLVFKDDPYNDRNVYVKRLKMLLNNGLEQRLRNLDVESIHIFGEIFGAGIQDLKYGTTEPELKIFDIAIDKKFLNYYAFETLAEILQLEVVPVLYRGPFSRSVLEKHRDGKTTLNNGPNIREGIVVRTTGDERKICKMVSPAYTLRSGDITELN